MGYIDIMSPAVEITGTRLTNALRASDINFTMGGQSTNETPHKQSTRLIGALAKVVSPVCTYRSFHSFLNILNSLYMFVRQKSSIRPPASPFNVITLL